MVGRARRLGMVDMMPQNAFRRMRRERQAGDTAGIAAAGTYTAELRGTRRRPARGCGTDLMGALLPTLQAEHLREGLTDYLATTFALTDPDAQAALTDFVGDPHSGMFKARGALALAGATPRSGPARRDHRQHR